MVPDRALDAAAAAPFFAIDAPLCHLLRYLEGMAASGHLDRPATHHAIGLLSAAILRQVGALGSYPKAIARALELAHAETETPPGVAALAHAAGMGLSRFHEAFRDAVGQTPGDYLAELRLDRAAALLCHGEMPIVEVALAVGFSDQSALTRALRRRRRVTPAELRATGRRAPRA
jgi:transcriptional regulator GlxA family with amidase domain